MGCLGVHFALDEKAVRKLKSFRKDEDRLEYVTEELEEELMGSSPERYAETDKAWDALHRALTDGKLEWANGEYPLNHVVLGGEILYSENDYIMSLKTPAQVRDVAAALERMTEAELRSRYFGIGTSDYEEPLSEEDFRYTWDGLVAVRALFARAAAEGRWVLFTADQ